MEKETIEVDLNDENIISYEPCIEDMEKACSFFTILESYLKLTKYDEDNYYGTVYTDDGKKEMWINKKHDTSRIDGEPVTMNIFIANIMKEEETDVLSRVFDLNPRDFACEVKYKDGTIAFQDLKGKWYKWVSKSTYSDFSNMKWLDRELERNSKSEGRNDESDRYYMVLSRIKDEQQRGCIDDSTYKKLAPWKEEAPIAYGYYMANIHYEFYEKNTKREELEWRIVRFMELSKSEDIMAGSWFSSNFMANLRMFLMNKGFAEIEDMQFDEWIRKRGNEPEKRILSMFQERGGKI